MGKEKPHINIIFIGNVDSGKSTTAGHIIYNCGIVDKATRDELEAEATETAKGCLKYAWLLHKLQAEHERDSTIGTPVWRFETAERNVTIADAPGYRDYVKNMITGISRADCVVLVVSCSNGEFEAGLSSSAQSRGHIFIAQASGVKQMIVACNKMDSTAPPFSEVRYNEVVSELSKHFSGFGLDPKSIAFVPISGFHGDNLFEPSQNMSWFQGWTIERNGTKTHGKTFIEALDSVLPFSVPDDKPLRLPVQELYKIGGIGTVVLGRVESGVLKPGMHVTFAPKNLTTVVKSFETCPLYQEALPGDTVGFSVKDLLVTDLCTGSVCSDSGNDPAKQAKSFIAVIAILNHPDRITPGYTSILKCHTAQVACTFVELKAKLSRRSGKSVEDSPKFLKSGDVAVVEMVPRDPLCVEKFAEYPALGQFVVRDAGQTVAVGIVKSVSKLKEEIGKPTKRTQKVGSGLPKRA